MRVVHLVNLCVTETAPPIIHLLTGTVTTKATARATAREPQNMVLIRPTPTKVSR